MLKNLLAVFLSVVLIFASVTLVFATGNDLEILPDKEYEVADVNTDGKIDVNDVTAIQKRLALITTLDSYQLSLADANGDGYVGIRDATYIQLLLVGIIKPTTPTDPATEKDNNKPVELPFVPAT